MMPKVGLWGRGGYWLAQWLMYENFDSFYTLRLILIGEGIKKHWQRHNFPRLLRLQLIPFIYLQIVRQSIPESWPRGIVQMASSASSPARVGSVTG